MNDVLALPNGANFILADLHMHTPEDKRFKCPNGSDLMSEKGRAKFCERYVQAALEKNLGIIALTEHNDVSWIDEIRDAARKTPLVVFPGFEISANSGAGGIHLLCLFEPERPSQELDDVITQLGLPRGDRFHSDGSNKICGKELKETISFVHNNGGVVVAAHVLRNNGILKEESMTGEVRVRAWTDPSLLAAEIPKARSCYLSEDGFAAKTIRNEHTTYKRSRPIACTYASDARSLPDIGGRATYIKLSSASISGLKQAFLDWDSRIRHPDELPRDSFSRIVAGQWEGGFLDGLKIHFNPNLNCIIGGKGTGKSTIVETLRFALGLVPNNEESRRQHHEIVQHVFKAGSSVRLLVESHAPTRQLYLIERSLKSRPTVFKWDEAKQEKGEEMLNHTPGDVFPGVQVYGQKEILALADDDSTQVDLLLRFQDKKKADQLETKEQSILSRLDENAQELTGAQDDLEGVASKAQRVGKLKERLALYKQLGLDATFSERKAYADEENLFEQVQSALDGLEDGIADFDKAVDTSFLRSDAIKELPHRGGFEEIREALEALEQARVKAVSQLRESVEIALAAIDPVKAEWRSDFNAQETRYKALLLEHQSQTLEPADYIATEKELGKLTPALQQQGSKESAVTKLQEQRRRLLTELQDVRRERFRVRQKAAQQVNEKLDGILKVEMRFEGNKAAFIAELVAFKSGVRRESIETITDHSEFSPVRLAEALRAGPAELATTFGITKTSAQKLYESITAQSIFSIETMPISDSISIQLNIGTVDQPVFKETNRLSVGQRCTAILLLILLYSPYPLIVDQPEDDLDNSFVYSDIVQRLRGEKERRQFIIATHNANIPVLGDAELIQVLHAERGKLIVDQCVSGSIDDKKVREPVETILEGGREAFEFRQAKYGF